VEDSGSALSSPSKGALTKSPLSPKRSKQDVVTSESQSSSLKEVTALLDKERESNVLLQSMLSESRMKYEDQLREERERCQAAVGEREGRAVKLEAQLEQFQRERDVLEVGD